MRKLLLFLLTVAASTNIYAETLRALVVHLQNGHRDVYLLSDKPEVRFPGGAVSVTSNSLSADYSFAEFKDFCFEMVDSEGIASVLADGDISIDYLSKERIKVTGVNRLVLFDLNGVVQQAANITSDQGTIVDLSDLPAGTYVLNINNQKTIKILR